MYHADSRGAGISAYDFDSAHGALSNPRVLMHLTEDQGLPDGAAVDVDGNYWSAGITAGCLNCVTLKANSFGRLSCPLPPLLCLVLAVKTSGRCSSRLWRRVVPVALSPGLFCHLMLAQSGCRGIANRSFARRFELADHVKVTGANLVNGLLTIDLQREIPEEMKPRRIEIRSTDAQSAPRQIDQHKQAA